MKFVIQRVTSAHVKVAEETVGKIGKGMLVLIGFTQSDKEKDIDFAANKLLNLRLWDDEKGQRWKESVKSLNLEILIVSQFTLYSVLKGNKSDFQGGVFISNKDLNFIFFVKQVIPRIKSRSLIFFNKFC